MADERTDSVERLLNLAMFLANSAEPVTIQRCREAVVGYDPEAADEAFARMFERDKKTLRASGIVIKTSDAEGTEAYYVDLEETFAAPVEFTSDDLTVLGLASASLGHDPSFPFGADLHLALAKLALETTDGRVANPGRLADEEPTRQGRVAAKLADAATARKRVTFEYTNRQGRHAHRDVEPYGVYSKDGRWYVVGRDVDAGAERVFALSRIERLAVHDAKPGSPDFERPADFDVAAWAMLPFQIGPAEAAFEARVRFAPNETWRAPRLSAGRGRIELRDDGTAVWIVKARDGASLARWVVENGPGVSVEAPAQVADLLRSGLDAVVAAHA